MSGELFPAAISTDRNYLFTTSESELLQLKFSFFFFLSGHLFSRDDTELSLLLKKYTLLYSSIICCLKAHLFSHSVIFLTASQTCLNREIVLCLQTVRKMSPYLLVLVQLMLK